MQYSLKALTCNPPQNLTEILEHMEMKTPLHVFGEYTGIKTVISNQHQKSGIYL